MGMEDDLKIKRDRPGKRESYIMGFVTSLFLTLVSYFLVSEQLVSGFSLILIVGVLALVQVVVQLVFFLHLGEEARPRWNLTSFLFMLLVVLIIVIGSIWIMHNLDYQMAIS